MNIERFIQSEITGRIGQQKVLIIYGTRRTGKTFILEKIFAKFKGTKQKLNGEDLNVQRRLSERTFENYNSLFAGTKLLVIDEAQNIHEIGKALKLMIDNLKGLTVLVSGSSSFDIANKSGEPLTGRSYTWQLYPVAQAELIKHYSMIDLYNQFEDRLRFGAYPEVLMLANEAEKEQYLSELVNAYLFKDILAFDGIRNANKLKQLLQLIAYQMGSEVSFNELSRALGINKITVERYLDLLHKNFVIFPLRSFGNNQRNEVTKGSKWYFYDTGIRNALIENFNPMDMRQDKGALFECFFLNERLKYMASIKKKANWFFWRNYDQQEVDFLEKSTHALKAFECKYQDNKAKIPPGFKTLYPEAEWNVVNRDNFLNFCVK